MYATPTPEFWIGIHLLSVMLAGASRVALSPAIKWLVMLLLVSAIAVISLLATAAFWTQQAHALFSCLTLGVVMVAVVVDRPRSPASDLVWKVASDTNHPAYRPAAE
jgi:hypothetical protein